MMDFSDVPIYLHRAPVDFRKAINGLSIIVDNEMGHSIFDDGLFVFCNKGRDKLKVLYWDKTGFCLWQKRLEGEHKKVGGVLKTSFNSYELTAF
jgi:transposase